MDIPLNQISKQHLKEIVCSVCGHDKVKKNDMLRCYYCERFYYDMHPEWIDHVLEKDKEEEDKSISAYGHMKRKIQE